MPEALRSITVIVPVYADWPSLSDCISSLAAHLDSRHTVLLVNDCGPDAESLGKAIESAIDELPNFNYFVNPTNLGFVRTCNRAVFELDKSDNDILLLNSDTAITAGSVEEMLSILYASDRHGTVCPRSNNATIASIPLVPVHNSAVMPDDYPRGVHNRIKAYLPRFTVAPVTPGFCMLIKRTLIENFGLFDEVYGHGYSEENDFCFRVNRFGYSSILANHAFVFHAESRSFSAEQKSTLQRKNARIMEQRYPHYLETVDRYLNSHIDPVDWFADAIAGDRARVQVMINLRHLPQTYNGTSKNALSLLHYLRKNDAQFEDVEFTIVAEKPSSEFYDLESFGFRVLTPSSVDEIFHVGYCPSQIFHRDTLALLNRHCLKIVFSHLDIISLRSTTLLSDNFDARDIAEISFEAADKVVAISEFTKDDAIDYFGRSVDGLGEKFVVIHQGSQAEPIFDGAELSDLDSDITRVIDRENYLLVVGNDMEHKMIGETLTEVASSHKPVVVLGPRSLRAPTGLPGDTHVIPGGELSDRAVEALYNACSIVFFPSSYEGFGLPIAEAAKHGKPLVLQDTTVAREIGALYESEIPIRYFGLLREIPGAIASALDAPRPQGGATHRNLDDYNSDVIRLLRAVADEDVDTAHLRRRWRYFATSTDARYSPSSRPRAVARALAALKTRYPQHYRRARQAYHRFRS